MGVFRREICFEIGEGAEGRMSITGTLRDTRSGELLHDIEVRAEIGLEDGLIHALEGEMRQVPYLDCRHGLETLQSLVGERIMPGFTQLVRDVVGSPDGCTHLAVLVTNLGHASVQGRGALVVSRLGGGSEAVDFMRRQAVELEILGNCYSWREDGPLMRRMRELIEERKGE